MKITLAICLLLAFTREPDPSYKLVSAPGHTYGYDIYLHGRLLIHQTSIPGLPGNRGFRRKRDAAKVAVLVMTKLQRHILPPTVTRTEMDSLKIRLK
ncbi:MAG TPA: DUF4907 domain-containing protein [Puia sp.]|nr:DUF4907 domain-containing protein [Puia sp.]